MHNVTHLVCPKCSFVYDGSMALPSSEHQSGDRPGTPDVTSKKTN